MPSMITKKLAERPHTDELVVVRCMLLQSWYGLSDPELEFQCNDRISFQNFYGIGKCIRKKKQKEECEINEETKRICPSRTKSFIF